MILMVVNNLGEAAENYSVDMPDVGFPAGLTVVDVLSCTEVVVDSSGGLEAHFMEGLPMVS
jgi:alpha-amylase